MTRESRLAMIKEIERKRGSRVIAYVTSDRPNLGYQILDDAVSILHDHILAIPPEERSKLDLFLYSRGGDSDVPWAIVSMFREYTKEGSFSVLIPYKAHSAATVISLGADEIVMTKKAELGPIDITMTQGPYNPKEEGTSQRLPISVEDVTGYFSLLEKVGCERPEEKMRGFEQLTNKVHPLALGTISRLLEQTQLVALRLLGTRANPFTEEKNRNIVKRLSSEIFSHRHTISRTEAINQLGLEQVKNAEDLDIDNELWNLYEEYRDLFSFDSPFSPEEHLIVNDLDNHTWTNLQVACIESSVRSDIRQTDLKVKKLVQVPPQLSLNVSNFALPPININPLPPGITPQQIAELIHQTIAALLPAIVNNAATSAANALLKNLPSGGFEQIYYNQIWKTEKAE
jgi:hypothetical protein